MSKKNTTVLALLLCTLVLDAPARFLSVDPVQVNQEAAGNFNRYYYANDNPYKFTDPDGREVTVRQQDQAKVTSLINPESETRYRVNSAGKLESTGQCNISEKSSASYSGDINAAIASPTSVDIRVGQTYVDQDGVTQDVDASNGGGMTANTGSGKLIQVSGNPMQPGLDADVSGNDVVDSAASILRHEITGHAVPQLQGLTGSSRPYGNVSRRELGQPALAPVDKNNYNDPVQ